MDAGASTVIAAQALQGSIARDIDDVGDEGGALVETYLDEEAVKRIRVGDGGIFMADGRDGPTLPLTVTRIDADATRVLPNNMLSAQFGGHILTRERAHKITPEHAVYRVTLAVALWFCAIAIGVVVSIMWRGAL